MRCSLYPLLLVGIPRPLVGSRNLYQWQAVVVMCTAVWIDPPSLGGAARPWLNCLSLRRWRLLSIAPARAAYSVAS
jgi:hypothetical protein